MEQFNVKVDSTRKNFLIVHPERNGMVCVTLDSKTDEELGEVCDFFEFNAISRLEVGEAVVMDGSQTVLRIS